MEGTALNQEVVIVPLLPPEEDRCGEFFVSFLKSDFMFRSNVTQIDAYESSSALAEPPSPKMGMVLRHTLCDHYTITPIWHRTFNRWSDVHQLPRQTLSHPQIVDVAISDHYMSFVLNFSMFQKRE